MVNTNLNEVAAEALEIFRIKLSGAVSDDARLYQLRRELTLAATAGLPYQWERLGDYMFHSQCFIQQVKLPLSEVEQSTLLEKMKTWCETMLAEAEKRAGKVTVADPRVAARGSIAASGSGVRHPGKKL